MNRALLEDTISAFISSFCSANKITGISVSLWHQEKNVDKSFFTGYIDLENNKPVDENSIFQLGCISKLYTGVIILKLVEQGYLSLESTVESLFTNSFFTDKRVGKIKIKHLLAHTSGFPFGNYYHKSSAQIIEEVEKTELLFETGSNRKYSQLGYALLGVIIEKVYNKKIESILEEQILEKASLKNTFGSIKHIESKKENIAKAYIQNSPIINFNQKNKLRKKGILQLTPSSGGMLSTSGDLLKFGQILLGYPIMNANKILSTESFKLFTQQQGPQMSYTDFSFFTNNWMGESYIYLGGFSWGQSSLLLLFPQKKAAFSIMCNARGQQFDLVVMALKIFYFIEKNHPLKNYLPDPKIIIPSNVEGDYYASRTEKISIKKQNNKFYLFTESNTLPLTYWRPNIFIINFKYNMLFLQHNGYITESIIWGDKQYFNTAQKVPDNGLYTYTNKYAYLSGVYYHKDGGKWWVSVKENSLLLIQDSESGILNNPVEVGNKIEYTITGTSFFHLEKAVFYFDKNNACHLKLGVLEFIKTR